MRVCLLYMQFFFRCSIETARARSFIHAKNSIIKKTLRQCVCKVLIKFFVVRVWKKNDFKKGIVFFFVSIRSFVHCEIARKERIAQKKRDHLEVFNTHRTANTHTGDSMNFWSTFLLLRSIAICMVQHVRSVGTITDACRMMPGYSCCNICVCAI